MVVVGTVGNMKGGGKVIDRLIISHSAWIFNYVVSRAKSCDV
jgi:hypothetical protein